MGSGGGVTLFLLFPNIFLYGLFIISCSFPFYKGNCTSGAGWQAITQAVTIIIPQKFRLSIHHADCPFVTRFGTSTTAITFFFIYLNDFPNHFDPSLLLNF